MRFAEDRLTTFTAGQGVQRRVHVWEPAAPRAVILAIHGGMAHGGDYVTPALYFRQHGIATVAYDLCGHQDARRVDIPGFHIFLDDSAAVPAMGEAAVPWLAGVCDGPLDGRADRHPPGPRPFRRRAADKGFILSSPYYVNAIKVSPVLLALSGVLVRWRRA
jgi:hypothetical protein